MILVYQVTVVVLVLVCLFTGYQMFRNAPQFQCNSCGNYYGSPLYDCPQCGCSLHEQFHDGDRDE